MSSQPSRIRFPSRLSCRPFFKRGAGLALALLIGGGAREALALEQTSGVNLTADEGFGARQQGMAVQRAGFARGADAVVKQRHGVLHAFHVELKPLRRLEARRLSDYVGTD